MFFLVTSSFLTLTYPKEWWPLGTGEDVKKNIYLPKKDGREGGEKMQA